MRLVENFFSIDSRHREKASVHTGNTARRGSLRSTLPRNLADEEHGTRSVQTVSTEHHVKVGEREKSITALGVQLELRIKWRKREIQLSRVGPDCDHRGRAVGK